MVRQESHRIQWQQWGNNPQSKRDLMTRSAAVRLTDAATAQNVISLLGESLQLEIRDKGSLVLIGTLYNSNKNSATAIQFEHELSQQQNNGTTIRSSSSSSPVTTTSAEPFHLIRTLQSDENPLQVRDVMQKVLDARQQAATASQQKQNKNNNTNSTIAPKLQWYFVPQDPSSQIPGCIELDGYSTCMEDEDMDEDDDETEDDSYEGTLEPIYPDPMDTPWRTTVTTAKQSASTTTGNSKRRQMRRYQQLSLHRSVLDHYIVSGYLWKQSHADCHVWRKVHCVLTEDHLWFVTRIKQQTNSPYYGRIGLSRALMLMSTTISTTSGTTTARIPYSWELVSARGQSHLFRAASRALQYRWTQCLQDRIQQCEENKLLQQAELIVADETAARAKRLMNAVTASTNCWTTNWAFKVVDYREQCRHIQHRLPSKTMVISTLPNSSSNKNLNSNNASSISSDESAAALPELEPELQIMVRDAWNLAANLLVQVVTTVGSNNSAITKGGRNFETLCRHIDYVLTGRMRSMSEVGTMLDDDSLMNKSRDAPPANLFDHLLLELQKQN